jgi:hypothetical protein
MMANDPKTVLAFTERVAKEGGWGEADVLAKRYVWLVNELALLEGMLRAKAKEHEPTAALSSWSSEQEATYRRFAAQLQRILEGTP